MKTKVQIIQHNRLDANSSFSNKTESKLKTAKNSCGSPIKILGMPVFRDRWKLEA